jgi:hypothetical protein
LTGQTAVCSCLARFFPQKVNKWDVQAETKMAFMGAFDPLIRGKMVQERGFWQKEAT